MYTNDIFCCVDEAFLSNYAVDAALYSVQKNHILNQSILKKTFMYLQKWFHDNYKVLNPGKCCCITFGLNTTKNEFVREDGTIVAPAEEHVVLGIAINARLTFYCHLKQLCQKVANKLNALTRIAPYLSYNQRRLIYSSFFTGQLSYSPLIWTFCSRQSNHVINNFQERALRVSYNDYDSSYIREYNKDNESLYIIYLDTSDLYRPGISQKLPADSFKWKENNSKFNGIVFNGKVIKTMMKVVIKETFFKYILNILKSFTIFTMIYHFYQKE